MFGENTVRLNAQDLSVDLSDHSMSHNPQVLEDYLALKIHHCYYSFSGNKIVIRGLYDRHEPHTIISCLSSFIQLSGKGPFFINSTDYFISRRDPAFYCDE